MTVKTNERPGTRAVLRYSRMSSYKAREVLDLIRGLDYTRAVELLDHTDRAAAPVVAKLLRSAAANAEHNDQLFPEELYVSTAYADEGATLKRWRPRARGRASRIRKRTCHITVILSRMPEDQIARLKARAEAQNADRRARRVAGSRRRQAAVVEEPELEAAPPEEMLEAGDEELALEPGEEVLALEPADDDEERDAAEDEQTGSVAEAKAAEKRPSPTKASAKKAAPAKVAAKKAAPQKTTGRKKAVKAISKIAKRSPKKDAN